MQPGAVTLSWWRLTCILLVALGLLHATTAPAAAAVERDPTGVATVELSAGDGLGQECAKSVSPDNVRVPRPERIHEPMRLPDAVTSVVHASLSPRPCCWPLMTPAVDQRPCGSRLVGVVEIRI